MKGWIRGYFVNEVLRNRYLWMESTNERFRVNGKVNEWEMLWPIDDINVEFRFTNILNILSLSSLSLSLILPLLLSLLLLPAIIDIIINTEIVDFIFMPLLFGCYFYWHFSVIMQSSSLSTLIILQNHYYLHYYLYGIITI